MSILIQIERADRGVYLRATQHDIVSQTSFAGGVIVADFGVDGSLVGLTVTRLGAIELQVLSDLARTYDLDLGALLSTRAIELARSAQDTMLPTPTPNEYWESVKRSEQRTAEPLKPLKTLTIPELLVSVIANGVKRTEARLRPER